VVKSKVKRIRPKSTQRKDEVKSRLTAAVRAIEQELGGLPETIGQRVKAIQGKSQEMFNVGFGKSTLHHREYKSLWHPKFRDVP
jgi:hypothetical protein